MVLYIFVSNIALLFSQTRQCSVPLVAVYCKWIKSHLFDMWAKCTCFIFLYCGVVGHVSLHHVFSVCSMSLVCDLYSALCLNRFVGNDDKCSWYFLIEEFHKFPENIVLSGVTEATRSVLKPNVTGD